MEEEIEVIADVATEFPDIKYIQTSDGKVHKITLNTTGTLTDGGMPGAYYLVGSTRQLEYSLTNTNDNIWWENNYTRRKTILHADAIALGSPAADGIYPIEINCESAKPYRITTMGEILATGDITTNARISATGDITTNAKIIANSGQFTNSISASGISAPGISRFGSLVVNNDSISEADANGKIIVGDNIIINSINKLIAVGSITLDGETGGVLIGRNIALTSDGSITANGSITAGTVTANAFYQDSDERLKTFTEDYDINLDNIKNIKTGKFYWNADDTHTLNGGVSAQTVEEYFPELVRENEEGIKTVNYDGLAVVAIAAIKKLTERIEQLEEIVRSK